MFFLAVPIFLSVVFFGLQVWHFVKVRKGKIVESKPKQSVETAPVRQKMAVGGQNHMLIICPKCKRVFSRPLAMLDFSSGKTRLVNVCPYCNYFLGCAEEEVAEKKKNGNVGLLDLDKKLEQK